MENRLIKQESSNPESSQMMRIRQDILMLGYPAERLNRGIALIRKNSLFAGSEKGGRNLVILYSFAASCKANGQAFGNWLKDVLPRLASATPTEFDELLPHRWKLTE